MTILWQDLLVLVSKLQKTGKLKWVNKKLLPCGQSFALAMTVLEDPIQVRQDREGSRNDRLLLVLDHHREPLEVPDLVGDRVDAVVDRVEAGDLKNKFVKIVLASSEFKNVFYCL